MPVFRVEKSRDFTVMSNHHLRNRNMSLRAKGLLSLMLSLPEDWDYTLKGLASISMEGVDAIRTVIRELEALGYLERRRKRNEKGQLKDAEYIIHERPIENMNQKQEPQQPMFTQPTPHEPISENPVLDEPVSDGTTQLNTNIPNTKELNTERSKYPSINNADSRERLSKLDAKRWMDRYNENKELVKENIDFEYLCLYHDRGVAKNIVNIMAEVLTVDRESYVIEGEVYPGILIQERFKEVDHGIIDAFLFNFEKHTGKIHNMKSYLITSLFNTSSTSASRMSNTVAYDISDRIEEKIWGAE